MPSYMCRCIYKKQGIFVESLNRFTGRSASSIPHNITVLGHIHYIRRSTGDKMVMWTSSGPLAVATWRILLALNIAK